MPGEVVVVTGSTLGLGAVIARCLGRFDALAALGGQASMAATSASKAALAALTRNAADAMAAHPIGVKGLASGWRATPDDPAIMRKRHGARLIHTARLRLAGAGSSLMTGAAIPFDQTIVGMSDASPPVPA